MPAAAETLASAASPPHTRAPFDDWPETSAAPTARTRSARTSRIRSRTTVALASPTPILSRCAIAPIRRSSPSLNGDTELTAKPTAVTAAASLRRVSGTDAARMICQRQLRRAMNPTDESMPSAIQPGGAHRADEAIEDEQADDQQDRRLDDPAAVQLRLPASRATVIMARKISC